MKNTLTSKSQQGFTVLEFLIVVLIMTILIGIALVGFDGARERSRDDMRISALNNARLSLEQYYAACRNFPPTLNWNDDQPCRQGGERKLSDFGTEPALPAGESLNYVGLSDSSETTGSFGSETQTASSMCIHYHIGIELENETHGVLAEASNFSSLVQITHDFSGITLFGCGDTGYFNDNRFDGGQPGMYDIFR